MKKRLIKPPGDDGKIIFFPGTEQLKTPEFRQPAIGTAHQPYFFNPGVSLKFLFLDNPGAVLEKNKRIIFLDTDRVNLSVSIESFLRPARRVSEFIKTDRVLHNYPAPSQEFSNSFFCKLEDTVKVSFPCPKEILSRLSRFKDIFLSQKHKFLKETLAESFLSFYGINKDYCFISEILQSKEFEDFFRRIYTENKLFRSIFNCALDDYKREFRFRYKNFPFPHLAEGELPFWVVQDGIRRSCFKKFVHLSSSKRGNIFPRAVTLTMFLRLYKLDIFIHGVGGANYEWVTDRVIEKFFKRKPPLYAVISGTFLIKGCPCRRLPYFFFSPGKVKDALNNFLVSK